MINAILRLAIEQRTLFLCSILFIIGIGVWSYQKLPIDAVPDITNIQVQINPSFRTQDHSRAMGYLKSRLFLKKAQIFILHET